MTDSLPAPVPPRTEEPDAAKVPHDVMTAAARQRLEYAMNRPLDIGVSLTYDLTAVRINDIAATVAEVLSLRAQLAARGEDTARLDWLDRHPTFTGLAWPEPDRVRPTLRGPNIRAALDAARQAEGRE